MSPPSNTEVVGEANKMTAWDSTTVKICVKDCFIWSAEKHAEYNLFLQTGSDALIIEYYAIQDMHALSGSYIYSTKCILMVYRSAIKYRLYQLLKRSA